MSVSPANLSHSVYVKPTLSVGLRNVSEILLEMLDHWDEKFLDDFTVADLVRLPSGASSEVSPGARRKGSPQLDYASVHRLTRQEVGCRETN